MVINKRKNFKLFMSRSVFLRKLLMAHINKINRFIENTSTMTFSEKKDISCKNNIGITFLTNFKLF